MKVFIAIPSYDSKICAIGMASILNNIKDVEARGIEAKCSFQLGDPYIEMARNHLVKQFLDGDCTDLLFVDTDLAFDNDAMWKLLRQDVGVIGGAYPYRVQDKTGFPADVKLDANRVPIADVDRGIIECNFVPTGFMRIRRSVFDVLNDKYPDNVDDKGEWLHFKTGMHFIDTGDKRWWGEDVYFCKICNEAGIKVWVDPSISFVHVGTLMKHGNYQKFLANGGI